MKFIAIYVHRDISRDPNYQLRGSTHTHTHTHTHSSKVVAVAPTRCFLAAEGGMINDE